MPSYTFQNVLGFILGVRDCFAFVFNKKRSGNLTCNMINTLKDSFSINTDSIKADSYSQIHVYDSVHFAHL